MHFRNKKCSFWSGSSTWETARTFYIMYFINSYLIGSKSPPLSSPFPITALQVERDLGPPLCSPPRHSTSLSLPPLATPASTPFFLASPAPPFLSSSSPAIPSYSPLWAGFFPVIWPDPGDPHLILDKSNTLHLPIPSPHQSLLFTRILEGTSLFPAYRQGNGMRWGGRIGWFSTSPLSPPSLNFSSLDGVFGVLLWTFQNSTL